MSDLYTHLASYSFHLSNGAEWRVLAADRAAETILERLAEVMTLRRVSDCRQNHSVQTVFVRVSDVPRMKMAHEDGGLSCVLPVAWQTKQEADFMNFISISAVITSNASLSWAILVHSALAEYNGNGVLFAASSGTGKTTASRRLPHWWNSLCDDMTLVVRDESGRWRAHPWPTWSAFCNGGKGGRWDVSHSVPIEAIFFLNQSEAESVEPLGKGEGLIRLVKAFAQVSFFALELAGLTQSDRKINAQWFSDLTDVVSKVPIHKLNLSIDGEFWKHVERAMDDKSHIIHSLGSEWKP